uniref:Truncated OipA n=1 Tax=Helicobacter pylori TaxID=210 RepID=G8EG57_HELPX|nr:truncated OipA [Helicobacter pylori]AER59573.1 truncated OipA [Helicobacter pylori]
MKKALLLSLSLSRSGSTL